MPEPRSIARTLGPWFGLLLLVILFVASRSVCIGAWIADGIAIKTCPDGRRAPDPRSGREPPAGDRRHAPGPGHRALHDGPADQDLTTAIRRFRPVAVLRTQGGGETALDLDWRSTTAGTKEATLTLPADLPDGEHELEVRAVTAAGEASTTVPSRSSLPRRSTC